MKCDHSTINNLFSRAQPIFALQNIVISSRGNNCIKASPIKICRSFNTLAQTLIDALLNTTLLSTKVYLMNPNCTRVFGSDFKQFRLFCHYVYLVCFLPYTNYLPMHAIDLQHIYMYDTRILLSMIYASTNI